MTKTEELLALADALEQIINGKYQTPVAKFIADTNKAADALREYAAAIDQEPVAQVAALFPEGPDGHGVDWLGRGPNPKPGALLYTHPPAPTTPQPARKIGGSYQADGYIVSRFTTTAGAERVVFEFNEPKGMLHIFTPEQIEGAA